MNFWRFVMSTNDHTPNTICNRNKETKHCFTFRWMSNGTSPQSEKNDHSKHDFNTKNIVLQLTSWLLWSLFHPYASHISVIFKSIHYRYIDKRPWKRLHLNNVHVPSHANESPGPRGSWTYIKIRYRIFLTK